MRKSFLVSSKNFLTLGKGSEKKHFFVSLRLPSFSPIYIALKLNQKIITKISNYLTENTFLIHPGNLPLKEIAFNKFKLAHTKAKGQNQSF